MTYRIRIDKIVSEVGYNMVAAEGKVLGKNDRKGQRVTFVGDARMMLPAMVDLEASKLPVCQVEEWQIR